MATFRDLRKTVREELDDPRLAVVFFETENSNTHYFVNVLNLGIQGVLIESDKSFENGTKPKLMIKNTELNQWDTFFCRVAWAQITESEKQYKTGLEFLFPVENGVEPETGRNGEITPEDIEFLLNTRMLKAISKDGLCSLLNCMSKKALGYGTTFISQENHLNCLYLIQKGLCKVQCKNESGSFQYAGKRREGDILGDMALLSSEPFMSDAVSESEMVVWELPRAKFDMACTLQPVLIDFLTGLSTNRLDNPTDSEVKYVGHHLITQTLGEGRTSFVYKGRHKLLNIPVAIKMMKHHPVMKKEDFNNFKKRIDRISSLKHPNIAQIYDIEEQYRTFFIIMEYIEGDSLDSFFDRKILFSFDNIMFFLAQICSAIAHAHDQKIIHNHLTPSNIFISKDRHVVVSDFGFTSPIPTEGFVEDRNNYYIAPEQIKGGKIDLRSDIYSLGILTHEMLTGRTLFSSGDCSAAMNMDTAKRIIAPPLRIPDFPEPLKKFILKACSKLPGQRYSSMHEIIEEFSNESDIFKEALNMNKDTEQEVSALLISHKKNQRLSLFRLLDEFSQKALNLGLEVNITGKIQLY